MPDHDPVAAPVPAPAPRPGIDVLLAAIEREPVPERLLALARELQAALRARADEDD